MMGELFYRVGYAVGQIESYVARRSDDADGDEAPPRPPRREARVPAPRPERHHDGEDMRGQMEEALKDAAETWFVSRILRPRHVSWPAVIFAGLTATALSDLVAYFTDPERHDPYDDDAEELLARYGAGIASTAAYAAILYPRLPGAPLTRGLTYGLLDVVTEPEGGIIAIARRLAPQLRFPLKPFAMPVNEEAGALARMAFGLALGLFYRASSA